MALTRRQVLREAVYQLRKDFKVNDTTNLNSVEDCMEALSYIVLTANKDKCWEKAFDSYTKYRAEVIFLKSQISELKKKQNQKWWHKLKFWK